MAAIQSELALNAGGDFDPELLAIHRGAIDQTTITTRPPATVMKKVIGLLKEMGVEVQQEGPFKHRCIRAGRGVDGTLTPPGTEALPLAAPEAKLNGSQTLYGESSSSDPGSEVRFSVQLTKLAGLNDTYSLDIRRLMGNLRSYKFLYDTIRERAELNS